MSRVIGWRGIGAAALAAAVLWSCQGSPGRIEPVSVDEIAAHIRYLSSDQMEGRAVATRGSRWPPATTRTTSGRWASSPPSERATGRRSPSRVEARSAGLARDQRPRRALTPALWDEFVIRTEREDAPAEASGELVYCGYLIQAPERNWDDIKGLDLTGKVLLVEINEPGNRPGGIFDGEDMTYYGRWSSNSRRPTELGAAGILIIHETKGRGLRLGRPAASWGNESFFLPDRNPRLLFEGWLGGRDGRPRPRPRPSSTAGAPARRAETPDFAPGAARAEGDGPPAPRLPDGRRRQRRRDHPGQTPGRERPDDHPLGPLRPLRERRNARRGPDLQRRRGQLLRLGGAPGHGRLLRPAARRSSRTTSASSP